MSPKILIYDLENSAATGDFWGKPYQTNIIRITRPSAVMSFGAKWYGEKKKMYYSDFHTGHDAMVGAMWELFNEADAVVSYNGGRHDTPHTNREILLAGGGPPSPFLECDLYKVVRKRFQFQSNKLDFVSQELQIGSKIKHEGYGLWVACMENDPAAWARFKRYNLGDIDLTEQLYERLLPWIPGSMHPNGQLFDGRPDECPRCEKPGHIQQRGYSTTQVGKFPRFHCTACGWWGKSGKSVDRVDLRSAA